MYHLAWGPLNNKTRAVATDRLLCAPPCVCTALCMHRLVCAPPCVCVQLYVFKPAVGRRAVQCSTKASTGRTGIAFHMQTKLPTSHIPGCLGATLLASVRTEKTNSLGVWAGLSAHVKMKNRLHSAKGATCSLELRSRRILLLSLLPTASIRTSIQRTGVQTGCRSQGSRMKHKSKHRRNRHCIPHADQATNPYTSKCEDHRRRIRANARIIADAKQTLGETQDK